MLARGSGSSGGGNSRGSERGMLVGGSGGGNRRGSDMGLLPGRGMASRVSKEGAFSRFSANGGAFPVFRESGVATGSLQERSSVVPTSRASIGQVRWGRVDKVER